MTVRLVAAAAALLLAGCSTSVEDLEKDEPDAVVGHQAAKTDVENCLEARLTREVAGPNLRSFDEPERRVFVVYAPAAPILVPGYVNGVFHVYEDRTVVYGRAALDDYGSVLVPIARDCAQHQSTSALDGRKRRTGKAAFRKSVAGPTLTFTNDTSAS